MDCRCDMPTGSKACHCRRCCLTFSSVSAFDRHIVRGAHAQPQDRGLRPNTRGHWSSPGPDETRRQTAAVRR